MGYHRAGFEVVGVDIKPQPNYPFEFTQGDALELDEWWPHTYDAIHASPPCQAWSTITIIGGRREDHPQLITPVRELLNATGLPYVIENVTGARRELENPIRLCGSMFDLGVTCDDGKWRYLERHRYFECAGFWMLVEPCQHRGEAIGVYGTGGRNQNSPTRVHRSHGYSGDFRERQGAMGIDWMTKAELSEAIPPAYTEFIGTQLMAHLKAEHYRDEVAPELVALDREKARDMGSPW